MDIRNVSIDAVKPYERNPRRNEAAVEKIAASLREFGWQQPIVTDAEMVVIAGHTRLLAAKSLGMTEVPVHVAKGLSPSQVKAYRLADNKLGEFAEWDKGLLDMELKDLELALYDMSQTGFTAEELAGFHIDVQPDDIEDYPDEMPGIAALKDDISFPSDLPWGIPALRADMLADIPDDLATWAGPDATAAHDGAYFYNWGSDSIRGLPMDRTLLGFYVDDFRFESFWEKPHIQVAKVLQSGIRIAIAPNFSMWSGEAQAVHLFAAYRSRWVARYMQEAGIAIIPDVNWSDERSFDFCLTGIPKDAPAISIQVQNLDTAQEKAKSAHGIAIAVRELRPKRLLVYGHGKTARSVFEESGAASAVDVVFVENRSAVRRRKLEKVQNEALR